MDSQAVRMTLLHPNEVMPRITGVRRRFGARSRVSIARAFTLLELLLVLALLVALAGFAYPTFDAIVGSRRLKQSAEKLSNELLEARVAAMRTGQAQEFRCTLNGNSYTLVPWLNGSESTNASAGATLMSASGQVVTTQAGGGGAVVSAPVDNSVSSKQLLEEVQFLAVDTLIDSRNALAVQQSGGTVNATPTAVAGGLSSPILIYPDGTCTTAQIVLADSRGRRMAIQLRGVTGQSNVIKLTAVDASTITPVIQSSSTSSNSPTTK